MGAIFTFSLFLLCGALASAKLYPVHFFAKSVRSDIFKPLRPESPPEVIRECGKEVRSPYGLLKQVYKRGEASQNKTCIWKLRAPPNHRINVIFTAFDLLQPTSEEYTDYDAAKSTAIEFYDSDHPEANLMATFYASPRERAGGYVQSISSTENMIVEIKYRDNVDFATQMIKINYEFLEFEKMMELLKAQKKK